LSNYTGYDHSPRTDIKQQLAALHLFWETGLLKQHNPMILDLGGAKGLWASALQWAGNHLDLQPQVFNIDLSLYATTHAFPEVKAYTTCGDLAYLPYPGDYFDMAVCPDVLEHIPENIIPNVLENIKSILKPKTGRGVLIPCVGEFSNYMDDVDPTHITMKDPAWWQEKIFNAGFRIHNNQSVRLARRIGTFDGGFMKFPIGARIPSMRPGLFVVSKD
jgi:ubiquinone/menaquinone biosynthesis C-methylase UbiE